MDFKKSGLIIDHFSDLISNQTEEHKGPIKVDSELNLASFRIQLENQNLNKESVPNSPSDMRGLQISPIALIIEPFRNFTSESKEYERGISQPQFINIVSPASDEENEDIEKSISLLTPNLKKLKFNQFTPTFPLKTDENISWDDLSVRKGQVEVEDVHKVNNQTPDFSDISNIERDSRSNGIGTYSELPTLLDAQVAKSGETPKDFSQEAEKEIEIKPQEIQDLAEDPLPEPNSINISHSFVKNNETLIFPSEPKIEAAKTCYSEKSLKKKRLLFKTPSIPNMIPIKKGSFSGNQSSIFTSNTPLIRMKKSSSGSINPARIKPKSRTSIDVKINGSPELQKSKSKSKTMKLPKLKEEVKAKTKTQFVPYMNDWSKSMLKTHFNVELKSNKDPSSIKSLVTKVVKKRNKIVKGDSVK